MWQAAIYILKEFEIEREKDELLLFNPKNYAFTESRSNLKEQGSQKSEPEQAWKKPTINYDRSN